MHFRILKMIATSGILIALECNKCIFGRWGPPRVPLGELRALPRPSSRLDDEMMTNRAETTHEEVRHSP